MFTFTDKQTIALSDIIQLAHKDILSTDVWTEILGLLGTVIPSDASAAIFFNPSTGKPEKYANRGFDVRLYQDYERYYHTKEPLIPKALAMGTTVWRPEDVVTRKVWESTEIYTDFMAANGFGHFVTSTVKFGTGVSIWLRLVRTKGGRAFTDKEVQFLRLIQPHFEMAHDKLQRGAYSDIVKNAIISSFDKVGMPIFIFDQSINLIQMNVVARALCESSATPIDDTIAMVRAATTNILGSHGHPFYAKGSHAETTFTVNDKRYALAGLPVLPSGSPPYFVMVATDIMQHLSLAYKRSMMGYGLSPREIEVCELLIKGFSNREIADRLCVAELTVKDHVKSIREKLKVPSRSKILLKLLSY